MPSEGRGHAGLRGLYAITPEMPDTDVLMARVEACLAAGSALVQYRAKHGDRALAFEQARSLAKLCRAHRVPLIVNDSIELAQAVRADGVHLGAADADPRRAREAMPRAIIGVSCYDDPQAARRAAASGADYVAIGSVFASATKPTAKRARLESLAETKRISGLPVAAIGGITIDNAREVVTAGADMLAVISALFDARDIGEAARAFSALFDLSGERPNARTQPRAV